MVWLERDLDDRSRSSDVHLGGSTGRLMILYGTGLGQGHILILKRVEVIALHGLTRLIIFLKQAIALLRVW